MKGLKKRAASRIYAICCGHGKKAGMELVQVAILVAIAIVVGLIFRSQIQEFVENVFSNLSAGKFL